MRVSGRSATPPRRRLSRLHTLLHPCTPSPLRIGLLWVGLLSFGSGWTLPVDAVAAGSVSLRLPAEFRTWKIRQSGLPDLRVSSWSLPWISTLGLASRTTLVLSGEGLVTSLTRPDQSLGDLSKVAAQVRHESSALPLTWIASVTSAGTQSDVSAESRDLRRWLSHPLLSARNDRWGRGVDFGGAAIWAPTLGRRARWALGAGFEVPGSYRVGDVARFRPGAEYSLSSGVEWQISAAPADRVILRVTGRTYGRDKLDDTPGIREGNQLDAALRWSQSVGEWRLRAVTQASWKGDGKRSDLDLFEVRSPGWLGAADFSWVYLGAPIQAGLRAEARRFAGPRGDARYGWSLGVGPVLSAGTRLRVRGEALYLQSRWEEGRADAIGTLVRLTVGYLP